MRAFKRRVVLSESEAHAVCFKEYTTQRGHGAEFVIGPAAGRFRWRLCPPYKAAPIAAAINRKSASLIGNSPKRN